MSLKSGEELKGLIVEKHEDRVILSTEKGETPILKETIRTIRYDDLEDNFLALGESSEQAQRWADALAYYEKALKIDPNFEEAKKAQVRVRNRLWSKAAAGPQSEIERRQMLYDSWGTSGVPTQKKLARSEGASLRDGLGVELEAREDWVFFSQVLPKKDAALAGLKKGDRLAEIDGRSLRYLSVDAVRSKLLNPRYSNFTLEYERDCAFMKTGFEKEFSEFGMMLALERRGIAVQSVKEGGIAAKAGIKAGDLLSAVNGESIRYVPVAKLMGIIQKAKDDNVKLSVRRSALLTRK